LGLYRVLGKLIHLRIKLISVSDSAGQRQQDRFEKGAKVNCNARMTTRHLKQHCKLDGDSHELISVAMSELNLSARAYDRILKVSRTIADLDGKIDISPEHVSEAIQYRTFDWTLWV
jgi:magnesium chelatase family protein